MSCCCLCAFVKMAAEAEHARQILRSVDLRRGCWGKIDEKDVASTLCVFNRQPIHEPFI